VSTYDLVRFDRIVYFVPDANDDYPVRRTCPTWYERHTGGRPPGPAEFEADLIDGVWGDKTEAAMDDSQRRTGVVGDMTVDSDAWRQWLHEVARAALRGDAYRALGAEATA
jgi:hypothetical protein